MAWDGRGAGSPMAHDLRIRWPEKWVRFHSLPDSKRYAETEEEYTIILDRHHTVLTELGVHDGLYVISAHTAARPSPDPLLHAGAALWQTLEPDPQSPFVVPVPLYASKAPYDRAGLDPLLRSVADWGLAGVIIAPTDLRWLYHPYDGGADVIASTGHERDTLKRRHAAWLSTHPLGL